MKNKIQSALLLMAIAVAAVSFRSNDQQYRGVYRVFENNKYEVLGSTGFYLYCRYQPTEVNKGKGEVMQHEYYFSKTSISDIKPLTIVNLENEFSDHVHFRYMIEGKFRSDRELTAFDQYLRVYKIEYLYTQSLK
jgi:hypothetical protein